MDVRTVQRLAETEGLTGFGPDAAVTDTLTVDGAPLVLRRNVLAFFQGNRFLLQDLVAHVVEQVPRGGDVVDCTPARDCSPLAPPRAGARG